MIQRASAVAYYRLDEPLYLSGEAERIAKEMQESHRESNAKEGLIQEFLEQPVPEEWDNMSVGKRRMFLQGGMQYEGNLVLREKICAAEIWTECLGSDIKYMKKMDSVELNNIMANIPGWARNRAQRRYGPYGRQRGFERENREETLLAQCIGYQQRSVSQHRQAGFQVACLFVWHGLCHRGLFC